MAKMLFLFLFSWAISCYASLVLTKKLEKIGTRFRFSQALIGMVTALGTNTPEIFSSIYASFVKEHEIAYGVIIGSNIVNLAFMLGIAALIAGKINVKPYSLAINAGIGLFCTFFMALFLFHQITIAETCFLILILFLPYLYLISRQPAQIEKQHIPKKMKDFFKTVVEHAHLNAQRKSVSQATFGDFCILVIALIAIVIGSVVFVSSALSLAYALHLSHAIMGFLILALLTSVPNIVAAVLLAKDNLAAAVISDTFNSNTLNFLTGICLPVLIFGAGHITKQSEFSILWLLAMIGITIALLSLHRGFHRKGGVVLIVLFGFYTLFTLL